MRKTQLLLPLVFSTLACTAAWASPASDEAEVGNGLARSGAYEDAIMFYDKALKLSPKYAPAIEARKAALRALNGGDKGKKGKPDEAATATAAAKTPAKPKPATTATAVKPAAPVVKPVKPPVTAVAKPVVKPVVKPPVAAVAKPPVTAVAKPAKPAPPPAKPPAVAAVKPAAPPHVAAVTAPAKPVAVEKPATVAHVSPLVKPALEQTKPPPQTQPIEDKPALNLDTPRNAHVPAVEDIQVEPPISGGMEGTEGGPVDSHVPNWLIGMAAGTFLLLIVLGVWWLSPTLSASRQLHDRLKGLERKER